jgi:hypothetical protein
MGPEHLPEFLHRPRIDPDQPGRLLAQPDRLTATPADRIHRPSRFPGTNGNQDPRSLHDLHLPGQDRPVMLDAAHLIAAEE